jgi:hypothetical protein
MTDFEVPVSLVDIAVGTCNRPSADDDGIFLADAQTRESLCLKNVAIDVQIEQGFADFKLT